MVCKKCGQEMSDELRFCPHCGQEVEPQEAPTPEEASQWDEKVEPVKMVGLADMNTHVKTKKKLTPKQIWIRVGIIAGSVLLALLVTAVVILWPMIKGYFQMVRESELDVSQLELNPALVEKTGVQNIALFGLDSRADTESGRSDAIIILSIDRDHNAIKMTSIARDSLVDIGEFNKRNYGESKITHAFGWGGAKLAVRTINRNYGMNITDYVYVNFYEFVELVDHVGGVLIDVSEAEARIMNNKYSPELLRLGFDYKRVTAGYQRLSGAQALAYSRDRYTGSDIERGNRQKEVLQALFDEVKNLSITEFPSLIGKVMSMCHTTLSDGEMLDIATWAMSSSPAFSQFSIPNAECKPVGGNWNDGHGWVYRYDMGLATAVLHEYIYEEEVTPVTTASRHPMTTTTTGSTTLPSRVDPTGTGTQLTDPTGTGTDLTDPTGTGTDLTDPTGEETTDPTDGEPTDPTGEDVDADATTTTTEDADATTTTTTEADNSSQPPAGFGEGGLQQ